MSVSELVKSRSELMSKIKEIDSILKEAVNAYGASLPQMPKPPQQQLSATAATGARHADNILFGDGYKPPITPMQPVQQPVQQGTGYPGQPIDPNQVVPMQQQQDPRNPFAGDAQSGFQLFNTDQWVAEQNALSMQQPQTEFDVEGMNDEISSLKQQISEGITDAQDSTTASNGGDEDLSSAA